jgi:hypothetical protein
LGVASDRRDHPYAGRCRRAVPPSTKEDPKGLTHRGYLRAEYKGCEIHADRR